MREQHDVIHLHQFFRHLRFLGEHVEAGGIDGAVLERLDQRWLVHHRAARHVDEDAVRTKRPEHLGIDHVRRRRSARHDHHQRVDVARHVEQFRVILIAHACLRVAAVIDHRHAEGLQPARDRLADAAHADHADGAIAQRRLGERILPLRPFSGAQKALRLRKFAHRAEQEAERGVGDFFVEHFRRVGDDDAMRARPFGVDVIVADAEARDLLELGKALHEAGIDLVGGIGDRDRTHLVGKRLEEGVLVGRVDQSVQRDLGLQPTDNDRLLVSDQQHIRFFASHSLFSFRPVR